MVFLVTANSVHMDMIEKASALFSKTKCSLQICSFKRLEMTRATKLQPFVSCPPFFNCFLLPSRLQFAPTKHAL